MIAVQPIRRNLAVSVNLLKRFQRASRCDMQELADADRGRLEVPRFYTVAEFRRRMGAYHRTMSILVFAVPSALFGYLILFGALAIHYGNDLGPPGELTLQRIVLMGCLFLPLFLLIIGFIAAVETASRKYRAKCPHCGVILEAAGGFHFAIALHCCPHCHNPLFAEWNSSPIGPPPSPTNLVNREVTFADIQHASRGRTRVFWTSFVKVTIATLTILAITSASIWICGTAVREWARHQFVFFDPRDIVNLLRVVPTILVFGFGLIWSSRKADHAFSIACHGCGSSVCKNDITSATGNCPTCGRRVIADAPVFRCDEEPETSLMERAEFAALVTEFQKPPPWWCFFLPLLGLFTWFLVLLWWWGKPFGSRDPVTAGPFLATCFGAIVALAVLVRTCSRRSVKRGCPYCKQSLLQSPSIVQATANCCHCGRRVLKSADSIGLYAKG